MRALDQNGSGYTSNVINAINFAVANKSSLGIDIINLSLGHPIYEPASSDPLVAAVEKAVAAGIVVVASAGNFGGDPTTHVTGYGGITSPGNAPDAITVGALDTLQTVTRGDDGVAWYSSAGRRGMTDFRNRTSSHRDRTWCPMCRRRARSPSPIQAD